MCHAIYFPIKTCVYFITLCLNIWNWFLNIQIQTTPVSISLAHQGPKKKKFLASLWGNIGYYLRISYKQNPIYDL